MSNQFATRPGFMPEPYLTRPSLLHHSNTRTWFTSDQSYTRQTSSCHMSSPPCTSLTPDQSYTRHTGSCHKTSPPCTSPIRPSYFLPPLFALDDNRIGIFSYKRKTMQQLGPVCKRLTPTPL